MPEYESDDKPLLATTMHASRLLRVSCDEGSHPTKNAGAKGLKRLIRRIGLIYCRHETHSEKIALHNGKPVLIIPDRAYKLGLSFSSILLRRWALTNRPRIMAGFRASSNVSSPARVGVAFSGSRGYPVSAPRYLPRPKPVCNATDVIVFV